MDIPMGVCPTEDAGCIGGITPYPGFQLRDNGNDFNSLFLPSVLAETTPYQDLHLLGRSSFESAPVMVEKHQSPVMG